MTMVPGNNRSLQQSQVAEAAIRLPATETERWRPADLRQQRARSRSDCELSRIWRVLFQNVPGLNAARRRRSGSGIGNHLIERLGCLQPPAEFQRNLNPISSAAVIDHI